MKPMLCDCGHPITLHRPGKFGRPVCYGVASDEDGEFCCDCQPPAWLTEVAPILRETMDARGTLEGFGVYHERGDTLSDLITILRDSYEQKLAALATERSARLSAEQETERLIDGYNLLVESHNRSLTYREGMEGLPPNTIARWATRAAP